MGVASCHFMRGSMLYRHMRQRRMFSARLLRLVFYVFGGCISISMLLLGPLSTSAAYGAAWPLHTGALTPNKSHALPAATGSFKAIASFHGIGSNTASMVGPGPAGSQLYYLTYLYYMNSFDLVAINPNNIANPLVFRSPLSTENGAYALTTGPDNNMYLGTEPNGHLMKFDTQAQQLTDLGAFPPDPATQTPQSYIWEFTVSPYNQEIYGCTYPTADLVSYDPLDAHPELINLGSMDPSHTNEYARYCVADPNPNYPYIYVGLGDVNSEVIAYNIATQQSTLLLSNSSTGFGAIYIGTDGNAYGTVIPGQYSKLVDGVAYPGYNTIAAEPTNVFSDGDSITVNSAMATVTLTQNGTPTSYPFNYAGEAMDVFRLAMGPDGQLYGSSILPAYLMRINEQSGALTNLGYLGTGEVYSLVAAQGNLYMGGYDSVSYGIYNPANGFALGTNPTMNTSMAEDLRSEAAIVSPIDNKIYLGSIAGYGQLNGPLTIADPNNANNITQYQPVTNESVVSLAAAGNVVIGGTSIYGGAGILPTATEAALFTWDPSTEQMTKEINVPNVTEITDLIHAPNGYIYGLGATASDYELFVVNPTTLTIVATTTFIYTPIYNSVVIGPDGNIWGLATAGIFRITTHNSLPGIKLVAPSPVPITGGFAVANKTIYFASNSTVYSFSSP
jgi:hypothetical protein